MLLKKNISVLMLCAPSNHRRPFPYHTKMADFEYFVFCPFSGANISINSKNVLHMASSDSQIAKLQRGCPKRADLPDVNINTGVQSINTERTSLTDPATEKGEFD